MTEKTQKAQINSRLKRIQQPNDRLSGDIFNLPPAEFEEKTKRRNSYKCLLSEFPNRRKGKPQPVNKPQPVTEYRLSWGEGIIPARLNHFDLAVLTVCCSELAQGNSRVTIDRIYRGLAGGKIHRGTLGTSLKAAILSSITKMMVTMIEVTPRNFSKTKYDVREIRSTLLPCKIETSVINGQKVQTIHMFQESPIAEYAKAKSQILSFDTRLLDVPNLHQTEQTVTLKFYIVERVLEIVRHGLTPTIRFDDVFQKCGLEEATKRQRQEARNTIRAVLEHLKAEKIIDEFTFEKDAGKYRAIKIKYKTPD